MTNLDEHNAWSQVFMAVDLLLRLLLGLCPRAVRHWRYSINIPKAAALYYDIVPVVHYVSLHLLWGCKLVEEEYQRNLIRGCYIFSVAFEELSAKY
jgi:hypothetical protein